MIKIDGKTIGAVFGEAVSCWGAQDFLVAPEVDGAPIRSLTYAQVAQEVARYVAALESAGYGAGQRVALLLGTVPEHYIVKLALNQLGMSCVPVNPDYRAGELAYLLEDSAAVLAIASKGYMPLMQAAIEEAETSPAFVAFEEVLSALPVAPAPAKGGDITPQSEASLLYTSGTTGRPKGCMLSHEYELMCGESYLFLDENVALREAGDRVLNPLPAFHINAGILTFFGMMQSGNCLIQPQRFSARNWWRDIQDTRATIFHYLGVVISVLLADRETGPEQLGSLRYAIGAGVDPALHVEFERRFDMPLIECWGMTEMCRMLVVDAEPRQIDTRAFGRARADLEAKVVGADDVELSRGTAGELLIRHSEATPQIGFFSGYLNKPEATAEAWEDGWFHTGDTVVMTEDGMLVFVDRAKNIIRRAGENIAAAEVENCLFQDPRVINVACLAAPDDIREEEVLACIVLEEGTPADEATARALFDHAFAKMSYFKPPGWVRFMDELPVTGTQKVVKHKIFAQGEDPCAGAYDFRALKKRG